MTISSSLTSVAAVLATTFACHVAVAQTSVTTTEKMAGPLVNNMGFSDRDRMKPWNGDKESLVLALKVGASKETM